ncbi:SAM-dependent methyltransferase [Microbacterium halotolerans]|uniref:SAM-dependent methyltransferase n=1 Tax=Microbacterium halotolerans TaxID=246613 RepID=UPI000E6AAB1E|nr:SAM-dependent methyltransferase [Microbacterium halotolerans]
MQNSWDVIVAGGGPTGLSAAVMLGRARRRALVIDAGSPRNRFADHMNGVLGHDGASPRDLAARGRTEAEAYGVEFTAGTIERVERDADGLMVRTLDGREHSTRALVVATGLTDDLPDIPGLAERWGRTVLHCPYCHGWEVRDKRLAVLTTSPLGLHQAELIRQWSDDVTVLTAGLGELTPETQARLRARGVRLESEPVAEVVGDGAQISNVRLSDGREIAADAIFTMGVPRPHDAFLAPLELTRSETPFGRFIEVDEMGRTSDERIWAVGNVVNPGANVPKSIGDGSFVGAAVNAALVTAEFDAAAKSGEPWPEVSTAALWEERYSGADRVWSHSVNGVLADVAGNLVPGRALDVGSGEGADVIWLAERGWDATGVDVSTTAVRRAVEAAAAADLGSGSAEFTVGDVDAVSGKVYDLVTSSFLHSPASEPREDILRRAAERVAAGGHLLITSHASAPPWAGDAHAGHHRFLAPEEEREMLALDPDAWEVVLSETRERATTSPDGEPSTIEDGVLLLRRRDPRD